MGICVLITKSYAISAMKCLRKCTYNNQNSLYRLFFFYWYRHFYNPGIIYSLTKGVVTMVAKINGRPIQVVEKDEEEKDFSLVYFLVSGSGYLMCFWLLDYVCSIFFFYHPFPFISTVARWIGAVLSWLF
jgi:hypothetical protein